MRKKKPDELTEADQKFIADNYLTMNFTEIGRHIGKTRQAVRYNMKRHGLTLPDEIVTERHLKRIFKPGGTPHNKGVRYHLTQEQKDNHLGLFKKGHKPKSTTELTFNTVASYLSRGEGWVADKELMKKIMQKPELVEAQKQQYLLNRKIKSIQNEKQANRPK